MNDPAESAGRTARRVGLGIEHGLAVVGAQIALARAFDFVPPGTRGQAMGACIAAATAVAGGFVLGARVRRRIAVFLAEEGESALSHVPWAAILAATVVLTIAGAIGFVTPVGARLFSPAALGTGGVARALFATDLVVLPSVLLLTLGTILGIAAARGALPTALAGLVGLAALSAAGSRAAEYTAYDPGVVRLWTLAFSGLAALLTGFAVSWHRRRLAFIEQCLVALFAGFAIYAAVTAGPPALIQASNVPEEQILLALVLAPTASYLCLLTVGGSIGFMLLGGGRLDTGFRYETAIAVRYLKANRRDRFIGKVTVISVVGVCLGVMALIVVLSVMSGFEDDLKQKILGAHAHIVLEKHGDDFLEYQEVEDQARTVEGVATAAAFVLGDAMISSDVGLSGTLVKGIDPTALDATADLRKNIERGSLDDLRHPERIPGARPRMHLPPRHPTSETGTTAAGAIEGAAGSTSARAVLEDFAEPVMREPFEHSGRVLPGIIIGRELSRTLRAYVGDVVKLVSPVSEEIGPTGPHPKLRRFRVAGIFFSGMYEYDAKFTYVDLKEAQRFFGMRDKATGVEIKVHDVDDTSRIDEALNRRVGGYPYTVKDWRMMNKELFSALLLEKLAMFIILTFIVLVASFNIVATLIMIVLEKGKEIAILKSLGASDASIMKVFVVQGLIVGVGGALLGFLGGVTICALIDRFGVRLDQRIFYIERLPVVMDWGEISAIAVAAVIISYLATIYPAITAARLRPVEGLRDD